MPGDSINIMAELRTIRLQPETCGGFQQRWKRRHSYGLRVLLAVCVGLSAHGFAQHNQERNRNLFEPPNANQPFRRPQPHLGQWFREHQDLTPAQQMQALQQEPGFSHLPLQMQMRLQKRLYQLDAMPPAQRERTLQYMEALERMTPEQRQQLAQAMQRINEFPLNRQMQMRRAFRTLRELPMDQRQQALSTPPLRDQFSEPERRILGQLLSVAPYLPPSNPAQTSSGAPAAPNAPAR